MLTKAVHVLCPLQANDCTLDRLQQTQREHQGQRYPERGVNPKRRTEYDLDLERQRYDDVADDQDDEISRGVIGAMMAELLAADFAAIGNLEERAEQPTLAAMWAATEKAAAHRLHHVASGL